jgi:hypothetical protein
MQRVQTNHGRRCDSFSLCVVHFFIFILLKIVCATLGFTFLRIPRSYYGILTPKILMSDLPDGAGSRTIEICANEVIDCLHRSSFLTIDGALDLYVDREKIELALDNGISTTARQDYLANRDSIVTTILSSRYRNLRSLLGDTVSEADYLGIVRNQILVDIQGGDLLYQIFTANILQRSVGEEAPFLEFIQRVCSKDVIKPGCGGFGTLIYFCMCRHTTDAYRFFLLLKGSEIS